MVKEEKMMADIHCHILYGLDDGAKTFEDTASMINMAYDDGSRTIVAVHHYNHTYKPDIMQVKLIFNSIINKFPEMKFYLCSECHLDEDLLDALHDGKCLTIADSRYVLIELDPNLLKATKMMLSTIINEGFIPVIAHCERLIYHREDLKKIIELRDMGCLLQVNASAV
jgi:protein-tyrosine phosphatase